MTPDLSAIRRRAEAATESAERRRDHTHSNPPVACDPGDSVCSAQREADFLTALAQGTFALLDHVDALTGAVEHEKAARLSLLHDHRYVKRLAEERQQRVDALTRVVDAQSRALENLAGQECLGPPACLPDDLCTGCTARAAQDLAAALAVLDGETQE